MVAHQERRIARVRGFTLLELLIVIGLLALLMALLLPAASGVRHQSRTLGCLSNLRQLQGAFENYTMSANRGQSMDYNIGQTLWVPLLQRYGKSKNVEFCPEATDFSYGKGTATEAWGPTPGTWMGTASGSYAFNGWLYSTYWAFYPQFPQAGWIHLPTSGTSDIPLFVDSIWIDTWPSGTDVPPASVQLGNSTPTPPYLMDRVCIDRHNRAVNVVFLDGHAQTTPLQDLWTLKWSANYVAPAVTPVIP